MLTRKHFDTKPAFPYKKPSKSRLIRVALWLAQSEHIKANRRRAVARVRRPRGLLDRVVNVFVPWTVTEYPGWWRWAGAMLGVKETTARAYSRRNYAMPEKHARTLAALCGARIAELVALQADLLAHAEQCAATVSPAADRLRQVARERSQGLRDRRGRLKPAEDL